MSKSFENLMIEKFNNMQDQFKIVNGKIDTVQLQLTNFQNQMQDQFSDVRKDIRRLDEKFDMLDKKVDTLDIKLDNVRTELKYDISDWSRAFDFHDRKIFQQDGEIKLIKAYVGMDDESMLTSVVRDKDNLKPDKS